ncbi:DUF423 domain-containing protein [Arcobacter vandammei]|uniref:DUF423 domain-containing protein n=1 Tax=Arcobacter vandammei TaxID=2782243 RepID=UPI0018DF571B|nr:DUF423 domain-containing protein [Arcobacter vandammei]
MIIDNKAKKFLALATFFMATAIMLGAFGAHGLKKILEPDMLRIFHTGVEYQFYNTFGLFFATFIYSLKENSRKIKISLYLIVIGTLIFSVSLYVLTILNMPILGAITPIGGTLQIIAYLLLFFGILKD